MHNVPLNSKQEHKEQALKDSKSYSTLIENTQHAMIVMVELGKRDYDHSKSGPQVTPRSLNSGNARIYVL